MSSPGAKIAQAFRRMHIVEGVLDLLQAVSEEIILAATRKTRGAKKDGKAASKKVKKVMRERKEGQLRSGRSKKKVKSKTSIAVGLSEARKARATVPRRPRKKSPGKKKK
jgi:hypothetical protein